MFCGKKAKIKGLPWFTDNHGFSKFEISDKEARVCPDLLVAHGPLFLSELLYHPLLYSAYPTLQEVPVFFIQDSTIGAAVDAFGNIYLSVFSLPNILHEVQHNIQLREGFPLGGTSSDLNYHTLPGEIEARDVQVKMRFTAKQRAKIAPALEGRREV